MIACICFGVGELTAVVIVAILGLFGIGYKKKHGVHGDKKCDCECHKDT